MADNADVFIAAVSLEVTKISQLTLQISDLLVFGLSRFVGLFPEILPLALIFQCFDDVARLVFCKRRRACL